MVRKFWTFAVAFLFVVSLASVVDAQMRRGNGQRRAPGDFGQKEKPGNRDQGETPGNGNQGEDPAGDPPRGTPDGETPAEEETCDDLKHGTPGLYGLCIAFCEAHDCVPDLSLEDPFSACKKNDRKILDNYNKKRRDGDPDMPCLPSAGEDPQYACPCWSQDDLAYFPFSLLSWTVEDAYLNWGVNLDMSEWDDGVLECEQYMSYIAETSILAGDATFYFNIDAVIGDCNDTYCSGNIGCLGADCPAELVMVPFGELDITEEEYLNCQMSIEQLAMTYGN